MNNTSTTLSCKKIDPYIGSTHLFYFKTHVTIKITPRISRRLYKIDMTSSNILLWLNITYAAMTVASSQNNDGY